MIASPDPVDFVISTPAKLIDMMLILKVLGEQAS
jgi:hypothetical protein